MPRAAFRIEQGPGLHEYLLADEITARRRNAERVSRAMQERR